MRMESRIAFSNAKYYRNKNIIIGIAVFLTSLLLFLVPTIGNGLIEAQITAVNKLYPTWHAVFRNVDDETVNKLAHHHNVRTYGVRSDLGYVITENGKISLAYMDETSAELQRITVTHGKLPQKANEIAVSSGMLNALGKEGKIGDTLSLSYQLFQGKGLGYQTDDTFVISGICEDDTAKFCLASEAFVEKNAAVRAPEYRFFFQVNASQNSVTDEIEAMIWQMAEQFSLEEGQVGINTEYLWANYVDPTYYTVIIVIMMIIVLAGIITIYSIYYVNMSDRVQAFGRLKAIGATKRQMKQIVLLEGLGIAAIGIPAGLLAGTLLAKTLFRFAFQLYTDENDYVTLLRELLNAGEISYLDVKFYSLTIVIAIGTMYLALQKPMRIAAKISEIDAMRYDPDMKKSKKIRKSRKDVSVSGLAGNYVFGNKRKSLITIVSMGITGIFVMAISTVWSCANPREAASTSVFGQYELHLGADMENKEHPERQWDQLIQNNPLSEELKTQIMQIDGILSVGCFNAIPVSSEVFADDWQTLGGVPEEYEQLLLDGIIQGHVTIEELKQSNKVIIQQHLLYWYPDIRIGDKLSLVCMDGTNRSIEVEVAAIGDYDIGFTSYQYILTTYDKVAALCPGNTNSVYHIWADADYDEAVCGRLQELAQKSDALQLVTWQKNYEQWKSAMMLTSVGCYVFLGVLAAICIMNMVNTMINSVQIRKKEIGMLQAIGMTDRQLVQMLGKEGLFYTLGTLLLSVGVGSLAGYQVYLLAKRAAAFNISHYHYPWQAALIMTVVLVLIQTMLAYALGKSVRKQTIIERIRFHE